MPEETVWRPKNRQIEPGKTLSSTNPITVTPDLQALRLPPTPVVYHGEWRRVFALAFVRALIAGLTLGFGRFWMTTRLRQHLWSNIRIDGDPLEYTGTAVEKLIGFMIAIILLATWLSLVNLALIFAGFSLFHGHPLALQLSLFSLLPLTPWAQYQARRYILSRTRWRGIRFGLGPGAGRYVLYWLIWRGAATISFGLFNPAARFALELYMTQRTYFGDQKYEQKGSPSETIKDWLMIWAYSIAVGVFAVFATVFGTIGLAVAGINAVWAAYTIMIGIPAIVVLAGCLLYIRYRVRFFNYIHSHKFLGRVRPKVALDTFAVAWILLSGVAATTALTLLAAIVFGGFAFSGASLIGFAAPDLSELVELTELEEVSVGMMAVFVAWWLPTLAVAHAALFTFITHRMVGAVAASTTLVDLQHVVNVRQRAEDKGARSDGFAEALGADIGGGF